MFSITINGNTLEEMYANVEAILANRPGANPQAYTAAPVPPAAPAQPDRHGRVPAVLRVDAGVVEQLLPGLHRIAQPPLDLQGFGQADPAFADNVRRYYEKVREEDLLLTHTLIPPQANRSQGAGQQLGGALTAHVVREDDSGVVIRGARLLATIGPNATDDPRAMALWLIAYAVLFGVTLLVLGFHLGRRHHQPGKAAG